ncbi:MAG: TlpA family protein disulfide reductase [Christensenellales bacterium]
MKQTFVLLLTLMLILTASAAVAQLGEPVQDFTVVNENGTLTALSGLLQTKKAVLLHFFAGWLDEDYSDLPAVQAAYAQYGEDIGFIVVSVEEQETVQSLAAARAQNELTDLPLSLGGLSAFGQFGSAYIPLTVVVNADGTSGFEFDGVLGAEALNACWPCLCGRMGRWRWRQCRRKRNKRRKTIKTKINSAADEETRQSLFMEPSPE